MHLNEILKDELAAFRSRARREPLDVLETGSIRNTGWNYRMNDGWSTVTLAEEIREHGGSLTSIDLNVAVAREVLANRDLLPYVDLVEGHSVEVLAGLVANAYAAGTKGGAGFLDVAFLDSDNDAGLIFHEYLVVKMLMRSPGLVIVDDVDLASDDVVKGHQILPWVLNAGIPHRVLQRHGDGHQTGVLIFETVLGEAG